jgi:ATP-dependent Clp protease ATP-binding subunit ClpA
MFERFTDRARRVVVLAQEEARKLHNNFIGVDHLFLGLASEGNGVAIKALESIGTDYEAIERRLRANLQQLDEPEVMGHIPFTPDSKRAMEIALREALTLNHNYIGTEHLLLGLIHVGSGEATDALTAAGVNLDRARQTIIQLLGDPKPPIAHRASSVPPPIETLTLHAVVQGHRYPVCDEEQAKSFVHWCAEQSFPDDHPATPIYSALKSLLLLHE